MEWTLLAVALGFALINGVNDGGALVSMGLRIPSVGAWAALMSLAVAVAVAPLISTGVAVTFAQRLVRFDGPTGQTALLIATIVAVVVVGVLASRGLPTSLTLAVVGSITGAGLGSDLPVSWRWVGFVLGVAAVAPLLGAGLAMMVTHLFARLPGRGPTHRRILVFHHVAYVGQCLAYGLNDGQKMLAVAGLALGSAAAIADPPIWLPVTIGAVFLAGAVLGLRRVSGTLGEALAPVRPPVAVVAEAAAAGAVLASTAVNAPVSMTQSLAGALIGGSGASHSYRRVRWAAAARILVAWVLTLPAAVALAAGTMMVVG